MCHLWDLYQITYENLNNTVKQKLSERLILSCGMKFNSILVTGQKMDSGSSEEMHMPNTRKKYSPWRKKFIS